MNGNLVLFEGKVEGTSRAAYRSTIIPLMAPTLQGKTTLLFKEKQVGLSPLNKIKDGPHLRTRRNEKGFMTGLEWQFRNQDSFGVFRKVSLFEVYFVN